MNKLSKVAFQKILKEKDFFATVSNLKGRGQRHEYNVFESLGEKLVVDYTYGLTWQQSGSLYFMTYAEAA